MIYEPDEDPFLTAEGASETDSSPAFRSPQPRRGRNSNQLSPNYQYQQQSMYQIPTGPGVPPPAYAMAQPPPGRIAQNPSFMMMPPPPGPMMRPVPSFYSDPGSQYPVGPMGQPYGMPPPAYYPPVPAAAGFAGSTPYRDRTSLTDQIEELERYERTRPPQYSSTGDNSLLIATLVSEQDALYGTNMLDNITAMDQEYIQGLMARGVPEHEALRMAFDRKPHSLIPPKVVSTNTDTPADVQALETAIQLSLTESSRRASRPDTSSVGALSPTSAERADREALETAIQLSLSEQESYRQQQQYRSTGSGYSNYQQQEHYAQGRGYLSHAADDSSVRSSGDHSYYSESSRDRPRYPDTADDAPRAFDRQYPYNLSREAPQEVLSRDYAISSVDKYRQAQQQQQQYFNHLQHYEESGHHGTNGHRSHHYEEEEFRSQQMPLSAREAEELRARAYGGRNPTTAPPPYANSRSPSPPAYRDEYNREYGGHHYEHHAPPPAYGETADDYSEGSRSRSDSGEYGPQDAPPPSYAHHHQAPRGPPVAYGAPAPQYISPPYSYDDGDNYSDEGKVDPPAYGRGPVPAPPRYAPPPQSARSGYSAGGGTTTEYSDSDGISFNRPPSSRDLRAPPGSERSYSPQAGHLMQPPEQDRQYLERERLHQQHVISTSQQSRTVTQQQQQYKQSGSHTEYTSRTLPMRPPPPQFAPAATRGIAVTSSSNDLHRTPSPSEFSTEIDEDGVQRPKHEWRKTLTRLVSNLTVDSDEEPSPE